MSKEADRAEIIYQVETKVPSGSIDKRRMGTDEEQEEQYPIPAPRPVPWQDA
jgi:hypothetical protein